MTLEWELFTFFEDLIVFILQKKYLAFLAPGTMTMLWSTTGPRRRKRSSSPPGRTSLCPGGHDQDDDGDEEKGEKDEDVDYE